MLGAPVTRVRVEEIGIQAVRFLHALEVLSDVADLNGNGAE